MFLHRLAHLGILRLNKELGTIETKPSIPEPRIELLDDLPETVIRDRALPIPPLLAAAVEGDPLADAKHVGQVGDGAVAAQVAEQVGDGGEVVHLGHGELARHVRLGLRCQVDAHLGHDPQVALQEEPVDRRPERQLRQVRHVRFRFGELPRADHVAVR